MTTIEAIKTRHTVRKFLDRKIPDSIINQLNMRIKEDNEKCGLSMKLVTENDEALGSFVKLLMAKNAKNYIILAGKNTADLEAKLGYCGTDLSLLAQTLGLNSWWITGTFNRKEVEKNLGATDENKVVGVLIIGFGATNGVPHKSKKFDDVCSYNGTMPEWFKRGVEAALLAPTALNKQAFIIKGNGNKVALTNEKGSSSDINLGIVKYHFEVGAGKEIFEWQ